MTLTRRTLVGSILATPAIAAAPRFARARAPIAAAQTPSIYRVKVGAIEVTAIHDGSLNLPSSWFLGDKAEIGRELAGAGQPDPTPTPVLAYLVNTGDKLVLVDTGYRDAGGPATGRMPVHLAAAGVKPEDVDVVALTHAHPDHVAGAATPDGKPYFPNAELVVADSEVKFWTSDEMMGGAPADAKPFFVLARASLSPYAARTRRIGPKADIVPGLSAEAAPGHTPGHTMFRVTSGDSQLLIFGDIVHSAALQFAHPEWSIAVDVDPAMAASTRRRVLDMAAADKLVFAGAHVPFPGMGVVVKVGNGYRYAPASWRVDL